MLDVNVNRRGGRQIELERFLIAVAELRETFAVWFRPFVAGAKQAARIFKERAVEGTWRAIGGILTAARCFIVMIDRQDFRSLLLRLLDLVVGGDRRGKLRIAGDAVAQPLLARGDGIPDLGIEQRGLNSDEGFAAVLNAEEVFAHAARVFKTAGGECIKKNFAAVQHTEQVRHLAVTHRGELIGR